MQLKSLGVLVYSRNIAAVGFEIIILLAAVGFEIIILLNTFFEILSRFFCKIEV
jgi:hypothetical protein